MSDLVTFKRTSRNPQHQRAAFGPTSISGGSLIDGQGRLVFESFYDDQGEAGSLEIPAGGELDLDLTNPFHKANYELFKRLYEAGQIPIELGIQVVHKGDSLKEAAKKRQLRRQAEDLITEVELASKEEFLGVAVRLGMGDVEQSSIEEVRQFLFDKAEVSPERLIQEFSNPDKDLYYLFNKAQGTSITNRDGVYYYGGQTLGYTVEAAIAVLKANKNLLIGLKADMQNRIQPVRVMPTLEEVYEDVDDTERLENLKSNVSGQVLETADALKHGLDTKQIQTIAIPGKKGQFVWTYNGIEIGLNEAQAFSFLEGNEAVRAAISSIKL